MDSEELQAHLKRLAQIRAAIRSGDPLVVRIHPHFNVEGFVAYVEWNDQRIFCCTLLYQPLHLHTGTDLDIVVMEKRQRPIVQEGDPERAMRFWLAREFGDLVQEHVRIERYVPHEMEPLSGDEPDLALPADIEKEIDKDDARFMYLRLEGVGAVTVDIEDRGWRRGRCKTGRLDGGDAQSLWVIHGRPTGDFRGRGWRQRLIDIAIRDLRGEFKAPGSPGWKPSGKRT